MPRRVGSESAKKVASSVGDSAPIGALYSSEDPSAGRRVPRTSHAKAGFDGPLRDRRLATHWGFEDQLEAKGATVMRGERCVVDGDVVSSQGVSAGVDMARPPESRCTATFKHLRKHLESIPPCAWGFVSECGSRTVCGPTPGAALPAR
jgi:DJ-1/PfpI family